MNGLQQARSGVYKASSPTESDLHYDEPLSDISVGWFVEQQKKFLYAQMFPEVPVNFKSNKFWQVPKGRLLRPTAKVLAPGARAARGGFDMSPSGYYNCEVWALAKDISDFERANQDPAVDVERTSSRYLSQQVALTREQQFNSTYMQPGVWTTTAAPQIPWNQPGSSPIADLRVAIETAELTAGGFTPNKIGFGKMVWRILRDHPDFLSRIQFGQVNNPAIVAKDLLAAILEVDEICVADAVSNQSDDNLADSMAYMTPNNVLVAYAPPEPGLDIPSAGYQFMWNGLLGMTNGSRILRYRDEPIHSDTLEIQSSFAMGVVAPDCGYLLQNVIV